MTCVEMFMVRARCALLFNSGPVKEIEFRRSDKILKSITLNADPSYNENKIDSMSAPLYLVGFNLKDLAVLSRVCLIRSGSLLSSVPYVGIIFFRVGSHFACLSL